MISAAGLRPIASSLLVGMTLLPRPGLAADADTGRRPSMRLAYLSFMVIAAAVAAPQVWAQDLSDMQQGRALANQVCSECHAVGVADSRSPNLLAPRFQAVAVTPGMTAMALNAFLHTSHRAMPNLLLTADQTKGIIAYILSLKK